MLQLAAEHRLPLSESDTVVNTVVITDTIADPGLEPALLAAEFCPRTR